MTLVELFGLLELVSAFCVHLIREHQISTVCACSWAKCCIPAMVLHFNTVVFRNQDYLVCLMLLASGYLLDEFFFYAICTF